MSGSDKKLTAQANTESGCEICEKRSGLSDEDKSMLADSLTPREKDTFLLLLEGYTLKETANRLGIRYSTANTYQTSVYRKLHVNSRAELIIRYRDMGGPKAG